MAPHTFTNQDFHSAKPQSSDSHKRKKSNPIKRLVNGWWDRLLGAAKAEGSFADQKAVYAAHNTKRDYVWNTIGFGTWGMVFPLLTIIVTQLVGVEQAGMFSLAFVTASLLMIVANYGVRTYQVSDVDEQSSFSDYQANRWLTCIIMMVVGFIYCSLRGYTDEMFMMSMGVYLYRMVDGLADVYEGRLQQKDKLYLGGISQTLRSVTSFAVFALLLLISKSLVVASFGMGIAAAVTFVVVTLPLALLETPKSPRFTIGGVWYLLKACFPVFIALFLYSLVDNMPKFVMESALSYDNQLYFNALYFPAQAVLISVGFIYKPLLVRMSNAWNDTARRRSFDIFIVAMVGIIAAITVAGMFIMGWIGIPVMSFMYGVDFSQFTTLSYVMLAAGGVTAVIDFLYQVITILRRQKVVTELYLITFGLSLLILILMINITGLEGAVVGYLAVMSVLLVLLLREYISVRIEYARHPELDPARLLPAATTVAEPAAPAHAIDASAATKKPTVRTADSSVGRGETASRKGRPAPTPRHSQERPSVKKRNL